MKIFHGWRMVGAGLTMQFFQAALLQQAFGAYVSVLAEERGWSKTSLSGAAALQSAESAIIGPVLGWILDRFGPRNMMRVGVLTFGAGFMLLSQVDSIPMFYLAALVLAIGASLSGSFPLNVSIINWFSRWRARALSSVSLGLAIGGIFVPVVSWSMQTYGWRATAFASGIIVIACGWPLASIFHRRPEEIGETVDGIPADAPPPAASDKHYIAAQAHREFTLAEALHTRAFWLIGLGHAIALAVVNSINIHAITHMRESMDYSLAQASLIITLVMVTQLFGIGAGWLVGDRVEKRLVAAWCMLLHAVALILLTYATSLTMLVAFAILHGIAWGLRGPFMNAIRADYFGRTAIGMILGISSALIALGQITGPMIAGIFADLTGDYRVGFTIVAVLSVLGSIAFLQAKRPV